MGKEVAPYRTCFVRPTSLLYSLTIEEERCWFAIYQNPDPMKGERHMFYRTWNDRWKWDFSLHLLIIYMIGLDCIANNLLAHLTFSQSKDVLTYIWWFHWVHIWLIQQPLFSQGNLVQSQYKATRQIHEHRKRGIVTWICGPFVPISRKTDCR